MPKKPAPPHPRELGATRFFARITALDLECPKCGRVFRLRPSNERRLSSRQRHIWDPATSRFQCGGKHGCQKIFILGVLAWDPPRGAAAQAVPLDQVPTMRQLAAMRAEGDGWWMAEGTAPTGRLDMSNLAVTEERPDQDDEDFNDNVDEEAD